MISQTEPDMAVASSQEIVPGVPVSLAALIIALDQSGAMPKDRFLSVLTQIWREIPEDDGLDGEAMACQRLLEFFT